jgi:uncharacterized protein involved in exopolysaccharide biosynthesis
LALRGNIEDFLLLNDYQNFSHSELCELVLIYRDIIKQYKQNNNINNVQLVKNIQELNVEITKLKQELNGLSKYKQQYTVLYNKLTTALTLQERLIGKLNLKKLTKP